MSIDEMTLMAYVDGEVDAPERARVEAAIAADPALADRVTQLRALNEKLAGVFEEVLAEPIPEHLLAAVRGGGDGAAAVVDLAAERAGRWARPGLPRPGVAWAAMAASLVVGLAAGGVMTRLGPSPLIADAGGSLEAHGRLARALDERLAAQGPAAGPIKVGLSFLSTDRRYCRTFQLAPGAGVAGVACREAAGWRVLMTTATGPAEGDGDYRMAASALPPDLADAVEHMIVGAPLDASGEAAARARGWRP